ncbi:MAG TPA: hypothetical protein VGX95_02635, partial [Xanthobacteraceae bacterium]|nr:hypothetical protein [Xanthobacteraceae bacterium]
MRLEGAVMVDGGAEQASPRTSMSTTWAAVATTIGCCSPHWRMKSRPSRFSNRYIWLKLVPAAESWMIILRPLNAGLSRSTQALGASPGGRTF